MLCLVCQSVRLKDDVSNMCGAATIAPNGRDGQQADVQRGYHRAQWARRRMCGAATIAPNGRDGEQADVRRGYHRAQWARWSTGGCVRRLPSRPMGATVNRRMCSAATIAPNGRDGEQADVRMCSAATIAPNGRDGEQADVQAATIAPNGRDGEQADVRAATIAPNGRDGQQADVRPATIAPNGRDGEQADVSAATIAPNGRDDVRRGYHRAQWARRSTGGCAARLPSRPMGATVNRRMCGAATIAPNGRDGQQADVQRGYHRAQWARRRMCSAATIAPNGRDGEQADVWRGYHRAQWARRSTGGCAARLPSRPMGATVNRRMCGAATIAPNGRDGEQADVRAATIAPNGRDGEQADVRMCSAATIAPNGRDGQQADVQRGYHRAQWARRSTGGCAARLPSRPMGATVNRRMCGAATIAPNGRDGEQADVRRGYHRAQWARRSTGGCAARLPSRPMGATVNRRMCSAATIAPNGRDGGCAARLPSRPMGATVNRQMCGAATIAPNGRDGQQADVRRGYHRAQWARRSTGGCAARLPSRPMGATVNRRMCGAATIAPNGRDGQQADVRRGYHRAQWARRSTGGRVSAATIAPNGRDGQQADVRRGYHRAQWARRSTGGCAARLPSRPMGATVNRQMCGAATITPNGRDGKQADVRCGYHRAQWARRSTGRCAARLPSCPMGATVNRQMCSAATIAPNGRDGEQADVQRGYHRAQWARQSTGRCAARLPSRPMGATVNRRMCGAATIAPNGRTLLNCYARRTCNMIC
ncbi:hypothetical protein VOLCADRAFT_86863 [Volvox carteri f. nagariensis]|uniref:Uncharacterized protein n=1 Tax=Volvox carteri f. nagariensis TaxID=3068 RepID=D8TJT6_VOLCA|nr:uncharacterized protein VOLCADRAFT_86863 [Volvox carteri f. nagariensis]EFJ52601.1 hypothetical protein VOLCADRAFT_86863 [Volvox carteri f. nagariensis]|eukprot:XP_002946674.1 hypothetical protein VOLCADRAFT_86863 [Volvox carteri f. nagariensis]